MPCTMAWEMRSSTGSERQAARPRDGFGLVLAVFLRQGQQPLGRVGAAIEQHILDAFAQRVGMS